jgi:hypothetical protein
MDLLFNISEIAIITGDNPYKTKRDYIIDFWKKNHKEDFEKYKKITEFIKETDEDIIKKISRRNNIDVSSELRESLKTKNINDLDSIKKNILEKIDNISEDEKKELTKSILNVTNTKFGIKNETDVTKLYENLTGNTIIKDNRYKKVKVSTIDDINIYIGGKIDGLNNDNGNIIEVKNRVNRLFYTLRDYEKVQIICYMYLFNSEKGDLVEAYKKKDSTDINIIQVPFNKDYMDNIINKLIIFAKYYNKFLKDHDMKINILIKKDEIDLI